MGNNINKDEHLRVGITLDSIVYNAGDVVTGTVCIRATANRPYQFLYLNIIGNEHVHWSQRHGKHSTRHYSQHRQTYREQFVLAKFDYGINTGEYTFPFSILLPANIPASLQFSVDNYIRTTIRAYLPPYDSDSEMQAFDYDINLREPLRFQQPLNTTRIESTTTCCCNCCQCCCCSTYSTGSMYFELEKNILNYNQSLRFRGYIDNSNGNYPISNYKIVLSSRVTQVATSKTRSWQSQVAVLHDFKDKIHEGQRRQIDVSLTIPKNLIYHTAIGNIIARQYFINLISEMGCCYNNAINKKHVILTNQFAAEQPWSEELQKMLANFNPTMRQEPIHFVNLRPYIYQPSNSIVQQNQVLGNANLMAQMNMINVNQKY